MVKHLPAIGFAVPGMTASIYSLEIHPFLLSLFQFIVSGCGP
jgi:hypothetical protein